MIVPLASPLKEVQRTEHHVLKLQEKPFEIACMKADSGFVSWFNTRFGSSWDGRMTGSLAGPSWSFLLPGQCRVSLGFFNPLTTAFCFAIFDFVFGPSFFGPLNAVFTTYPGGVLHGAFGVPSFGHYQFDHSFASLVPYLATGVPESVVISPCDVSAPPSIVQIADFGFTTPDGPIAGLRFNLYPDGIGKWKRMKTVSAGTAIYQLDFQCIIDSGVAYALKGCAKFGDPMGYAEFDQDDCPSVADGWPVGTMTSGNAHGMDGLPAGIAVSDLGLGLPVGGVNVTAMN